MIVAAIAVVCTLSGAAAFAYFLAGTGTGSAATATITALTLSTGTSSTSLYPGSSTTVNVLVSNSNTAAIQLNTVSLDTSQGVSGFAVDSAHSTAGCTAAAAALTFPTVSTGWTIAGSTSNTALALPANALSMATTAPSACQGATFTVFLKAA